MRRGWSRFAVTAVVAGVIGVLGAGCKPKVGGTCKAGMGACDQPGAPSALVCVNGAYAELPCRGPQGCFQDATKKIQCDDSVANDGDPCLTQDNSSDACTVDKKEMVECTDGKFKMKRMCRGPKTCGVAGDTINCDLSVQLVGDPCGIPGNAVCSVDKKQRLTCKDGAYAIDRYCRGSKGCSTEPGSGDSLLVDCDESVASLNDPCGVPGYTACADDGKNELVCQGGKFVEKHGCPRLGCHVLANGMRECQ